MPAVTTMEDYMTEDLISVFKEKFGADGDIRSYFAPGRVNLIGEHTDYNGGHVFPCAISMGNYAVARKRNDTKVRWYSVTYPADGIREADITELKPNDNGMWYDYQQGVIWALKNNGYKIENGYDMVMMGDIPAGAGLSASASIELVAAIICKDLFNINIDMVHCALMGQYSENRYNGMNCGIMDQFASAMGKKDCAIFLDTATLKYDYVPLNLKNEKIVITNSKVKHKLAGSAYNDRRHESEEALSDLKKAVKIETLGDLSEAEFEKYKYAIKNPICLKRAKHALYENQRTIKAVDALKKGDIEAFGRLMDESHISLRDDYEVSCKELDILVDEALKINGVIGSRMTGGGFGGCTVSIVRNENVDTFKDKVGSAYKALTGNTAEFYIADAADGTRRIG
jgi:galactokinase